MMTTKSGEKESNSFICRGAVETANQASQQMVKSTDKVLRSVCTSCPNVDSEGVRSAARGFRDKLRRAWPPLGRACGRRSTQSLPDKLRRAWPPLDGAWLLCGTRSRQSLKEVTKKKTAIKMCNNNFG